MIGLNSAKLAAIAVGAIAAGLTLAAPAQADDPDMQFARELHTYGIYGQRDYNAWLGKLVCKRMYHDVDHDAYQSAKFVATNLPKDSTTQQSWQFLNAAVNTYCPEKHSVIDQVAAQQ